MVHEQHVQYSPSFTDSVTFVDLKVSSKRHASQENKQCGLLDGALRNGCSCERNNHETQC